MSFIYPRTVAITRPNVDVAPGYTLNYSGVLPSQETPVASGLPASIQLKKEKGRPNANLPADQEAKTLWSIFIPAGSAALGLIQNDDIATDDLGVRYQVLGPYWNSLGYALIAERLDV